ncbi:hypothetical protein OHA59_39955 [Streptomyces sp. NBC_01589]|uniref:hypothetical protein n=1 Tax=Streptomyces sp. NBC_01589 TaxID=2975886 RepID=UPI0038644D40
MFRQRLVLDGAWTRRWKTTWLYDGGQVVWPERDLESVPVLDSQRVRRFTWRAKQRHRPGLQYVLKPFTFATLRDRLIRYAEFHAAVGEASGQDEVDRALATLRAPSPAALPKGLSAPTLERVTVTLRDCADGLTATGVAEAVGISRITARRYLEHLVDSGRAARAPQYGQVGRPELQYRWVKG